MTTRIKRTHDFREYVKLEYSFKTLDKIIKHGEKYGDIVTSTFWYLIVLENEFRIEWIKKVSPQKWGQKWSFKDISDLYKFDISWVDLYPNEEWDWDNISANFKLDIEWVRKYPDKKWNFKYISSSFDFNINWIKEYPNKPWDWSEISTSTNFCIEWIDLYPDKEWDWNFISNSYKINCEWLKKYPDKNWNWEHIILSKHFTLGWLKYFPDEWTVEIVLEMINKKNKQKIPIDDFIYRVKHKEDDKTVFYNSNFRQYMAAYKIQQWWHFITMSPNYKIGRKFINKKYDDLF